MNVRAVIDSFADKRVLIVGDVMIDSYLWGSVKRISPEAPVPIVTVKERSTRLGGAANVGKNVRSLGAKAVLATVIGDDANGDLILPLLEEQGIETSGVIRSKGRKTTIKTRVISGHQHICRVDDEQVDDISSEAEAELLHSIGTIISSGAVDVIILEDYNKGVLTESCITSIISLAREAEIPVAVDPKKENFLVYRGVQLFKPNLVELKEGLKIDLDPKDEGSLRSAVSELREQLRNDCTLLTLSEHGVYVDNGTDRVHIPAHERSIADVSGAGDSVIATAALCLASGVSIADLAALSNLAGGIVCEKVGVVPIDRMDLLREALEKSLSR